MEDQTLFVGKRKMLKSVALRDGVVIVWFAAVHRVFGVRVVGKGSTVFKKMRSDRECARLYRRVTGKRHAKLEAALKASGR